MRGNAPGAPIRASGGSADNTCGQLDEPFDESRRNATTVVPRSAVAVYAELRSNVLVARRHRHLPAGCARTASAQGCRRAGRGGTSTATTNGVPLRTTTAAATSAVGTASAAHRTVPSSTAATTAPTIKAPSCLSAVRAEPRPCRAPWATRPWTATVRTPVMYVVELFSLSPTTLWAPRATETSARTTRAGPFAVHRPRAAPSSTSSATNGATRGSRERRHTERARRDAEREPGHRGGNGNEPRRITRGQCAGESHQVAGHDPREGVPERDHRHQVDRSGCRGEQHARRRRAGTGADPLPGARAGPGGGSRGAEGSFGRQAFGLHLLPLEQMGLDAHLLQGTAELDAQERARRVPGDVGVVCCSTWLTISA